MHYTVATHLSLERIKNEVNMKIKEGYKLIGGLVVGHEGRYYQAMVKISKPDVTREKKESK